MSTDSAGIWQKCLQIIATQINPQSFKTWFDQSKEISLDENKLIIQVKNQFIAEWLATKYNSMILNVVQTVTEKEMLVSLAFSKNGNHFEFIHLTRQDTEVSSKAPIQAHLNPRYTFDTFVVGDFNRLAFMSAMAVAESPGKTKYNPLYIQGGVGLGKTHLIQAIGQFVKQNYPQKVIRYVSSERFTDRFIDSLINKTTSRFREFYRSADVLLVDDVQFFSGKEGIQNEFFHLFNALHQRSQQIVLTSDVPPAQIKGLEERLVSRFQWGLIVDLQVPEFESRVAILRKKAEADGIELPEEVLSLIAQNINTNVRELEGTLIRLLAFASIHGREITEQLAMDVIGQYAKPISQYKKTITLEDILNAVSQHIGVSPEQIRGKRRTKNVALARQMAMYLSRKLTGSSLKHIGQFFGGRDHATVVYACKVIPERSGEVRQILSQIETELKG
ncbi:chromosomal replication initiator protein DnaA [bacterium]|nr:MAG: chromosomal replication initiator protein DnaA [bacterium]